MFLELNGILSCFYFFGGIFISIVYTFVYYSWTPYNLFIYYFIGFYAFADNFLFSFNINKVMRLISILLILVYYLFSFVGEQDFDLLSSFFLDNNTSTFFTI